MKKIIWISWLVVTVVVATYYGLIIFSSEDKSDVLIGDTTHGHFQIEMACSSCHTREFGGKEMLQDACTSCHAQELEAAHDSHPKKKFTDPRDAYLLDTIDARYCVSCHTEHNKDQTREMGVTLPDDFCFHCHQETIEERESHKGLAFDTCASSGCHNFHDNRALFETFLVENADQPWLAEIAAIPAANHAKLKAPTDSSRNQVDVSAYTVLHGEVVEQWPQTVHAQRGITCAGCHAGTQEKDEKWIGKPGLAQCESCHQNEADGFQSGKHGMRLAQSLSAMTPALSYSSLIFDANNLHAQQGCNSCHRAHDLDMNFASTQACLTCHADEHSLAFEGSPHGKLWETSQLENEGEKTLKMTQGVSCATCHMPRKLSKNNGVEVMSVEHNQNDNLRPNEKMIRPVCMQCHSLAFSIDALADENLIKNNFNGKAGTHIESVDWALKRSQK